MRTLICKLSAAALILGCWTGHSQSTNTALTFYVVSDVKMEGARFIDTAELPKVGYIAAKPDLAVTNLQDVYLQKMADFAIMGDGKGKHTVVPSRPPPALAVKLGAEDAKRFTSLTERSVGKRLLVMLGDKPLTAPRVVCAIEGGSFVIDFRERADLKMAERALKHLPK